ncbi:MAG: hypothetical protein WBP55_01865 [Solirubrobacterales bacterium]
MLDFDLGRIRGERVHWCVEGDYFGGGTDPAGLFDPDLGDRGVGIGIGEATVRAEQSEYGASDSGREEREQSCEQKYPLGVGENSVG